LSLAPCGPQATIEFVKRILTLAVILSCFAFACVFFVYPRFGPPGFEGLKVTLNRSPQGDLGSRSTTFPIGIFGSYEDDVYTDSHITLAHYKLSAIARDSVTLRVRMTEQIPHQPIVSVDRLITVPANESVQEQLTPDTRLIATIVRR
jgi:hypothetical protein